MERYIVVFVEDAAKAGYPDAPAIEELSRWGDCYWMLYETDGEKPIRLVGQDGGSPEDQSLVRDWDWVVTELNRLAPK